MRRHRVPYTQFNKTNRPRKFWSFFKFGFKINYRMFKLQIFKWILQNCLLSHKKISIVNTHFNNQVFLDNLILFWKFWNLKIVIRNSANITLWDLNIGVDINIYGNTYKIYDCDAFTRHFLVCQGIAVGQQVIKLC